VPRQARFRDGVVTRSLSGRKPRLRGTLILTDTIINIEPDRIGEPWRTAVKLTGMAAPHGGILFAYLRDVLERIVSGKTKANELNSLLPWAWKASQAQAAVKS
jgi:hypothetical protein